MEWVGALEDDSFLLAPPPFFSSFEIGYQYVALAGP